MLVGAGGAAAACFAGGQLLLPNIAGATATPARPLPRRAWPSSVPTPRAETLVFQMGPTENYDNFNPYVPNGETIGWGVHQTAREPFFIENLMTGEMVPWLATGYEYNADSTALTINLNPAAAWSDGEPFTSADVQFVFEMLAANEELYGNEQALAAEVSAPDDHTIVFGLATPSPRWHRNFVSSDYSQWIRVVPKHIWEGEDPGGFAFDPPVYTGPYTLAEANPQTQMYIWEKNPDYWNPEAGFNGPKFVVYTAELPIDARVAEFEQGSFDFSNFDYLNQEVVLANNPSMVSFHYPDPCPRALSPNNLSPLFKFPEARWALSLLADKEVIANTIMQPPTTAVVYPWADYGVNEKYQIPELAAEYDLTEYNPEKAGELLDSIGCTLDGDWRTLDGESLNLTMITPSAAGSAEYQIAELVVQAARSIGLNMELANLQGPTYDEARKTGDYDVASYWMCLGGGVANIYSYFTVDTEAGEPAVAPIGTSTDENVERIDIPELLPIAEKLATLPEDEASASDPAFAEALEIFYQQLPWVPTVQTLQAYLMNTTYWTGWPTNDDPYAPAKSDIQPFLLTLAKLMPAGG